jgi:pentatricopeptide repeat protein
VMGEGAAMAVLAETEEVQGEGSTEQQTKVNRRMLKKKKRLLTKGKGTRSDYFDVYGAQARAELVLQPPMPNARLSFQDEHVEEPADPESDEEEEDDYDAADATPADYGEVSKILASRFEDGQTQYLIEWKDDHLESWEPADNIARDLVSGAGEAAASIMISVLGRLKKVEIVLDVSNRAQKAGFGNNVYAYSAMVSAYGRSGRCCEALKVFQAMKKAKGVESAPEAS